jgi:hypothetical protein
MAYLIPKLHISGSKVLLVTAIKLKSKCKCYGSHRGDRDECHILACDAAWSGKSIPSISEKRTDSIFMVEE